MLLPNDGRRIDRINVFDAKDIFLRQSFSLLVLKYAKYKKISRFYTYIFPIQCAALNVN